MNPWLRNMKWNNTVSIYKVGCGFAQMQAAPSCLCLSAHLLWCSSVSHPSQVSFSRCGEQLWKSDLFSSHYTFSLFHGVWSTGFLLVFPLWNVHRICHLLSCSLLDAGKLNSQRSIFTWAYGNIQRGEEEARAQSHSSMYAILAESKEPHNGRGHDWVSWALNCKGSMYEGCGEGVCPLVRLLICTQDSVIFGKAFHLSGVERRHHHRHNRQKSALFQAESGGPTSFTWLCHLLSWPFSE